MRVMSGKPLAAVPQSSPAYWLSSSPAIPSLSMSLTLTSASSPYWMAVSMLCSTSSMLQQHRHGMRKGAGTDPRSCLGGGHAPAPNGLKAAQMPYAQLHNMALHLASVRHAEL